MKISRQRLSTYFRAKFCVVKQYNGIFRFPLFGKVSAAFFEFFQPVFGRRKGLEYKAYGGFYPIFPLLSTVSPFFPIASKELAKHTLNSNEQQMLETWNVLLKRVKKTAEYNPQFTYGLYQIEKEINLQNEDKEYIHPDIYNDIQALKVMLKTYYAKHIVKKLFKYELLK